MVILKVYHCDRSESEIDFWLSTGDATFLMAKFFNEHKSEAPAYSPTTAFVLQLRRNPEPKTFGTALLCSAL